MSAFSEQVLVDRLTKLNPSQQSIQTLSHWILYHRKQYEQVVSVWLTQFRASRTEGQMTLLYLANDIVQNSRKKSPQFVKRFELVLPEAARILGRASESDRKKLGRVLDVWEERHVYSSSFINQLRQAAALPRVGMVYSSSSAPVASNSPHTQHNHTSSHTQLQLMDDPVIRTILELRNMSDSDSASGSEAVDALPTYFLPPPEAAYRGADDAPSSPPPSIHEAAAMVADQISKGELAAAVAAVSSFKSMLEADIERRTTLVNQLTEMIEKHEALMASKAEKLNQCTRQLDFLNAITSAREGSKRKLDEDADGDAEHIAKRPRLDSNNHLHAADGTREPPLFEPHTPPTAPPPYSPVMASDASLPVVAAAAGAVSSSIPLPSSSAPPLLSSSSAATSATITPTTVSSYAASLPGLDPVLAYGMALPTTTTTTTTSNTMTAVAPGAYGGAAADYVYNNNHHHLHQHHQLIGDMPPPSLPTAGVLPSATDFSNFAQGMPVVNPHYHHQLLRDNDLQ